MRVMLLLVKVRLMNINAEVFCGLVQIPFQCKQRMEDWTGLISECYSCSMAMSGLSDYKECVNW